MVLALTEYDIGDKVRSSVVFANSAGTSTDPTAVTFAWRIGDGTVTTYTNGVDAELVKDDTGDYHVDLTLATAGVYYVRWLGTGTVASADEDTWVCLESRVV
jgi:hypothetical protein